MGSVFSVADFLDMLARRRRVVFLVFVLGCILSLYVAASQRHMYSSSEVLQMQGAIIPGEMAATTVQGSDARRLQLIEQQIMSRTAILEIAKELDLFADQPALTESEKVVAFRNAVRISEVSAARQGFNDDGEVSLVRISVDWPTAEGAQSLAQYVAQRTMELSTNTRLVRSRDALDFFSAQEQEAGLAIDKLEREISQFRASNDIALPGNAIRVQNEIATLNESILAIDRQMIALQRQIAIAPQSRVERRNREQQQEELDTLTAQRALLTSNLEAMNSTIQGTPEAQRQLDDYDRKRTALQAELEAATARRKEAEIAYRLETQRQADRLTVLEPAALPEYPYTRSRKVLALLGAVASMIAAVATAFLLDLRHPVIRSAAQMEHTLGLRPVVSIPQMRPRKNRRRGLLPRPLRRR
ncbi:DUF874 domain-containing protein [Pseudosulfitobacter sp. DSM 107133]|uniref:DUF874 domain-containing protein n=1 Tax=Pseudosulfitobacter sp. DSM 107133 TaxID=2883100 RepID=UPI000DF3F62B|nr:DUF874 domain-containing protein [Pseudosulfitobacter sp. DSM 107133]UOA26829.1 hypothetical protein DSM107133_01536 [Pseudosulfitobacter sp. DSM 107133]